MDETLPDISGAGGDDRRGVRSDVGDDAADGIRATVRPVDPGRAPRTWPALLWWTLVTVAWFGLVLFPVAGSMVRTDNAAAAIPHVLLICLLCLSVPLGWLVWRRRDRPDDTGAATVRAELEATLLAEWESDRWHEQYMKNHGTRPAQGPLARRCDDDR